MADTFDTLSAEVGRAQEIAASASGGTWAADIVRGDLGDRGCVIRLPSGAPDDGGDLLAEVRANPSDAYLMADAKALVALCVRLLAAWQTDREEVERLRLELEARTSQPADEPAPRTNDEPPMVEVGRVPRGCMVAGDRWADVVADNIGEMVKFQSGYTLHSLRQVQPIPHPDGPAPDDNRWWWALFRPDSPVYAGQVRRCARGTGWHGYPVWWLCPEEPSDATR